MKIRIPAYTEVNIPPPVDNGDIAKPHIPSGAGSVVNGVANPLPSPVEMSQVVNGRVVK